MSPHVRIWIRKPTGLEHSLIQAYFFFTIYLMTLALGHPIQCRKTGLWENDEVERMWQEAVKI
jgi:hypothetical protein